MKISIEDENKLFKAFIHFLIGITGYDLRELRVCKQCGGLFKLSNLTPDCKIDRIDFSGELKDLCSLNYTCNHCNNLTSMKKSKILKEPEAPDVERKSGL